MPLTFKEREEGFPQVVQAGPFHVCDSSFLRLENGAGFSAKQKLRPKIWDEARSVVPPKLHGGFPMPLEAPLTQGTRRGLRGAPGRLPAAFPGRLSAGGVLSGGKAAAGSAHHSRFHLYILPFSITTLHAVVNRFFSVSGGARGQTEKPHHRLQPLCLALPACSRRCCLGLVITIARAPAAGHSGGGWFYSHSLLPEVF